MRGPAALEELKRLLPACLLPDQVRLGRRLAEALARQRQGRPHEAPLAAWLAAARASIGLRERRARILAHVEYPLELPITRQRETLVAAIREHPTVVVAGETGSGKTTQLPKMCLEAGLGLRARIGCTQPRRIAALAASRRLAEELQVDWGAEVGCKMRFSDQTRPETAVKVMTDGILLAEIQGDPDLTEYEALIIDEAHERSLNIDFALGHLRQLQRRRDDLKVIITSATLDTERFAAAFGGAPVVEVAGRLFPVELRHWPFDPTPPESPAGRGKGRAPASVEEPTYVDAAVEAVAGLLAEPGGGDILAFLPTERDIREMCERLETAHGEALEALPLFGRLSAVDQHRVFQPGRRRRVVVATNVAETSLTVPRIRFVVDTGLARVSRYHSGTRSRRLPIEPVSQSSANQRKGRCGRVAGGICVRLYSEADFRARPLYAEPEIQRCNLAEVVLRLKAFRLGEIETFPFLDPPLPAAIRGAYELLQELSALDAQNQLTPLGHEVARLPVDPAIGRMILEARRANALAEVTVIAAGLSVQDPRERPFERQAQADAAHRRFQSSRSDFLTLVNIWNGYHDTWESLQTQGQLRHFCRTHFLSFNRMREWVDIHAQLCAALEELGGFAPNTTPAAYEAVHRAILTGLLSHVARHAERHTYRVAASRAVTVFPGSGLLHAAAPAASESPEKARGRTPPAAPGLPAWVVAGEFVETSRPFARTLAAIEPEWVIELAPHLCRTRYTEPAWDRASGQVVARERLSLRGLELRDRRVAYGRIHPTEASAIFIRDALVGEDLPHAHEFQEQNRRLCEKLEYWRARLEHRLEADLAEALGRFYQTKLADVSSAAELNRWLRGHSAAQLRATEADLLGEQGTGFPAHEFPDAVPLGGQAIGVSYSYAPGKEGDGVGLSVPAGLVPVLAPEQLAWLVPVQREERLVHLLNALPKALRRPLAPVRATARKVVEAVHAPPGDFLAAVRGYLRQHCGVDVPAAAWASPALPAHLAPAITIVGRDGEALATGRDLEALRQRLQEHETPAEKAAWTRAVSQWERYAVRSWNFGPLPEQCLVTEQGGLPLFGYPGLQVEGGDVHVRLFRKRDEALAASRAGAPRLAEWVLHRELAWVQKDLRPLLALAKEHADLGTPEELFESAWEGLRRRLLHNPPLPPMGPEDFQRYVAAARERIPGLADGLVRLATAALKKRGEVRLCRRPYAGLAQDLRFLVPPGFLRDLPLERLEHLPRYLQALLVRAERAAVNPPKDAAKYARVRPYLEALRDLLKSPPATTEAQARREEFRWLLEEYKVACFAQELGAAVSVSPQKLDAALAAAKGAAPGR